MVRANLGCGGLSFQVLPQHLWDGEHEGIMEYDTHGSGQEVWTEIACQRPEQEEPRALLLLQLPEELSLVWQSAPQCHTRRQGLLLPARRREAHMVIDKTSVSEMHQHDAGAFQVFNVKQTIKTNVVIHAITDGLKNSPGAEKSIIP